VSGDVFLRFNLRSRTVTGGGVPRASAIMSTVLGPRGSGTIFDFSNRKREIDAECRLAFTGLGKCSNFDS
jgi:hypothetical protein